MAEPNEAIRRRWRENGGVCAVCTRPLNHGDWVIEVPGQDGRLVTHAERCWDILLRELMALNDTPATDPAFTDPNITQVYALVGIQSDGGEGIISIGLSPVPCIASRRESIAKAIATVRRMQPAVKMRVWRFTVREDASGEFGL